MPTGLPVKDPVLWLTEQELVIFRRWPSETRRSEWLAGRLAAKRLLSEEHRIAPLSWSVGRDGVAPALERLAICRTRCFRSRTVDGAGAATLSDSRAEGSAGVDIQRIRPVHPGLCARVFTPDERQQIAAQFGSENSTEGMLLLWALERGRHQSAAAALGPFAPKHRSSAYK